MSDEVIVISAPDDEPGENQDQLPDLAYKVGTLSASVATLTERMDALEARIASTEDVADQAASLSLEAAEDAQDAVATAEETQDVLTFAMAEEATENETEPEAVETVEIVVEEKEDEQPEKSHWLTRPFSGWKN